jgi:hypothetical protein
MNTNGEVGEKLQDDEYELQAVRAQLQAPTVLPPVKEAPVTAGYEAGSSVREMTKVLSMEYSLWLWY